MIKRLYRNVQRVMSFLRDYSRLVRFGVAQPPVVSYLREVVIS